MTHNVKQISEAKAFKFLSRTRQLFGEEVFKELFKLSAYKSGKGKNL